MTARVSPILNGNGHPFVKSNGKSRPELLDALLASNGSVNRKARKANMRYDAARDTDEFKNYWANSDALDADGANSKAVRHKLLKRSRYEKGSNGYYSGILETHVNMIVGSGPSLRMQTLNPDFNQLVERRFKEWSKSIQFRRKLWCLTHARQMDGESFAILVNNPMTRDDIQLDMLLIEAEQCQSPHMSFLSRGHVDGIRFDEFNNIIFYEVLPAHPGSTTDAFVDQQPIQVPANQMLHWFKMERPGTHRGIPALTSTMNLGAAARRWREAELSAAETAADFTMFLKTQMHPDLFEGVEPLSAIDIQKRMMMVLPDGYDPFQMKAEHPNNTYADFHRSLVSEQARPISMPYNAAACDSSTYSFASGKLDTLCYRATIDNERRDCEDQVVDPLFTEWFKEFSLVEQGDRLPPNHKWDWPAHPVIDAEAEAKANDVSLKNGSMSLQKLYSNFGRDYEDELRAQAIDTFGDESDESVDRMRKINVLRNTPSNAIPQVAALLGLTEAQEPVEAEDE